MSARRLLAPTAALLAVGLLAAPSAAASLAGTPAAVGDELDGGPATDLQAEVADRLLIRWAPDIPPATRARVLGDLEVERVTDRIDTLHLPGGDLAAVATHLAAHPTVDHVEPDQVVIAPSGLLPAPLTPPDDPLFAFQWALHNTGQAVGPSERRVTGSPGNDIRVLEAWETTRGAPTVTVAVIDSAVDEQHPDLAGTVVGTVDLTDGQAGSRIHGTAVASVIAANADDAVGMAGVAPEVRILSIGAFAGGDDASPGSSTLAWVTAAFQVAADRGADVITASWVAGQDSALLRAAIADTGIPVVAAAGNDGRTLTPASAVFPATYELSNLVTVTAIGPEGSVPGFANVGADTVDVAAPGEHVLVAVGGVDHGWSDGTSFAVPHVAGGLALARSAAPYATTTELVDAVRWTSRAEPALAGRTIAGGSLDVAALVTGVQRPVCPPDAHPDVSFTDLAPGNDHRAGIACVVAEGLLSGRADGQLRPAELVTREQVASLLARVLDQRLELAPAPRAGFTDVDPAGAHAAAIDRLAELGILRGDADGRFRPRDPVSRGQLATLLVGTYELLTGDVRPPSRSWFRDAVGTTHEASLDRARDLGLLAGTDRLRVDPAAPTRRDQAASLLARHLDALERQGEAG